MIEQVKMFRVRCDICGKTLDEDNGCHGRTPDDDDVYPEVTIWDDDVYALQQALDSGWTEEDGKLYCTSCYAEQIEREEEEQLNNTKQ